MRASDFKIGKRYKWSPYWHGANLFKNGILQEIKNANGQLIGLFITRDNEQWEIPLDADIRPYKERKN